MKYSGRMQSQHGFSLLEVLVAIVVFAVGLLAIASLQGNLMQSGSDAKARTVATSLAEAQVEQLRTFLEDDDYDAVAGSTEAVTEGGVEFQRSTQITDYYYQVTAAEPDGQLVAGTDPDTGTADIKLATVTVSWCDAEAGSGCNPADLSTDPNTVVVEDVIGRSLSPVGSAKALSELTPSDPPRLPYTPGEAPNTISIDLEDGSKKESPQPTLETTRGGSTESEAEKVSTVTRIESIVYNTLDSGEVSVQRQEFLAANCTCATGEDTELSAEQNIGHTPIFWDGNDWVGRVKDENKPVGHFPGFSSSETQRGVLCRDCCRDHHDSAAGTTFTHVNQAGDEVEVEVAKFNPFRDSANTGDHDHFDGALDQPVTSGAYLEACRFARVDGRMLVTTDFRLESLQVLPGTTDPASDPQPFEGWIDDYRNYVKDFVEIYATEVATGVSAGTLDYPAEQPQQDDSTTAEECDGPLPCGDETAYGNRTSPVDGNPDPGLPSFDDVPSSTETRQLVGRAIYLDYLHPILQDRINCRLGNSDPATNDNCDDRQDVSGEPLFPILPFFEVNLALQANWAVVGDDLINVSDEPVASTFDSATFNRGTTTLNDSNAADSDAIASIEQGNVGLTDTHDITPFDCTDPSRLIIDRLTYEGPGTAASGLTVSGCLNIDATLIEGDVIAPSDVEVTDAFGNDCGTTLGDNFFECRIKNIAVGADDGSNVIVVSNYSTNQTDVQVCLGPFLDESGNATFEGGTVDGTGKNETTTFDFGENDQSHELDMKFVNQATGSENCPSGQLK